MKIGIISDIHGNFHAFEKIYTELKKEACDLHLFLGDVCGYYFQQNDVIDMLRSLPNMEAIAGNHDLMFLKSLEDDQTMRYYTDRFGLSFQLLKETITPENLAFLKSLPREFHLSANGAAVAAFHGSPWSPTDEYIYPDAPMERFDSLEFRTVFLGHTHRPMDIMREDIRVVNPGSAGQPRDGGWPSYAVYDKIAERLEIKRVPFDVDACIDHIRSRDEHNHYLTDVFRRIKK